MSTFLAQHRDVLGTVVFLVCVLGLLFVALAVLNRWMTKKHFKSMAEEVAQRRRLNEEQAVLSQESARRAALRH